MKMKKLTFAVVLCTIILYCSVSAFAQGSILKKGMSGESVVVLQDNLRSLGYFNVGSTGYFGDITNNAVRRLQENGGIQVDGIVGNQTFGLIDKLFNNKTVTTSRGGSDRTEETDYLMPWFGGVNNFFKVGDTATVYDVETGLSFSVKRTYGYNHSDTETVTAEDTAIMKKVYGGQWSWNRRAVIVTVNGKKIAASLAGMPHAGVDSAPMNTYVQSRSGGFGSGTNLDTVKGNGMSGHFDLHFLGSKTHGSNKVDQNHQAMVKKAAQWAKNNY